MQAITIVHNKNRDHHFPKDADFEIAIMDTTTGEDRGNQKLIPVKNAMTQLT